MLTLISRKSEWGREQLRELVTSAPSCEDAVARLEAVMADTRPHWPDQQIIRQSGGRGEQWCKLPITITTSPLSEVDAGSPGPFAKYGEALSSVRVSVAEEGYQTRYSTVQYNTMMYSTVQYTAVHCSTLPT